MCATARQLDGIGTHGCQSLMPVVELSYPIRFSDPHEQHQTVIHLGNYSVARRRSRFRRLCITDITGCLRQRVAPFCRWVPYANSVDSETTSFVWSACAIQTRTSDKEWQSPLYLRGQAKRD